LKEEQGLEDLHVQIKLCEVFHAFAQRAGVHIRRAWRHEHQTDVELRTSGLLTRRHTAEQEVHQNISVPTCLRQHFSTSKAFG
jgi:hypothetical protein